MGQYMNKPTSNILGQTAFADAFSSTLLKIILRPVQYVKSQVT